MTATTDAAVGASSRVVADFESSFRTPKPSSKYGRILPFTGGTGIGSMREMLKSTVIGGYNPRRIGRGKEDVKGSLNGAPNLVLLPFLVKAWAGNLRSVTTGMTTLSADIDNSVTTLVVTEGGGFPAASFDILIGTEQMTVSAIDTPGTGWTITRGVNSTTPASHTAGAAITLVTDLAGAIASTGATSLSVDSGTGFPAAPFVVNIGTEHLKVTSKGSGTNWTVVRGYDGTTAATHLDEAIVSLVTVISTHTAKLTDTDAPASIAMEHRILKDGTYYYGFGSGLRINTLDWTFGDYVFKEFKTGIVGTDFVKPTSSVPGTAYDTDGSLHDWDVGDGSIGFLPLDETMLKSSGGVQVDGVDVGYIIKGGLKHNRNLNTNGYTANSEGKRKRTSAKRAEINGSLDLVFADATALDILTDCTALHTLLVNYLVMAAGVYSIGSREHCVGEQSFAIGHPQAQFQENTFVVTSDDEITLNGETIEFSKDPTTGTSLLYTIKNDQLAAAYV